jgi:hypothetical protein
MLCSCLIATKMNIQLLFIVTICYFVDSVKSKLRIFLKALCVLGALHMLQYTDALLMCFLLLVAVHCRNSMRPRCTRRG